MKFYTSKVTGLKYHYEVKEAGLPFDLAFVHGNLASRRWWYPVIEFLPKRNQIKGKGRVFLLEFLGCGLSEAPRSQSDVDIRQFAKEFNEILKSEGFHGGVIGHSTGGLIAALMMSYSPQIFKGGFLLDPVGAKGVTFDESMTQAFEAMKSDKALTAKVIGSTIKDVDMTHPFFIDVIVEDAFLAVKQVGDKVLRALSGFNAEAELALIEKPVWVLHGEEDKLLPIEDSKRLSQLVKKGRFIEVPNAGHCLNYENPQKLSELLLELQNHILLDVLK
jgi:pimeloyl-ACP methyl ester carboxylesterase